MKQLQQGKTTNRHGDTTKDDYANALRLYQAYLVEIKTDQRDEAVAFSDENRYYDSSI